MKLGEVVVPSTPKGQIVGGFEETSFGKKFKIVLNFYFKKWYFEEKLSHDKWSYPLFGSLE